MFSTRYITRVFIALACLGPAVLLADNYALDWWTVDGGGDMWATGGGFELSGTIAQPDRAALILKADVADTFTPAPLIFDNL